MCAVSLITASSDSFAHLCVFLMLARARTYCSAAKMPSRSGTQSRGHHDRCRDLRYALEIAARSRINYAQGIGAVPHEQ